ncbi:Peptidase A1 [Corchorus capsularis]|uniref:Peptidase A1 n=1 Tax=Corchorus capsularis TaxID=210143 RepID=A0A1R3HKM2_COCAP|nr:Peptidase A1 [Corchorus capsularis]
MAFVWFLLVFSLSLAVIPSQAETQVNQSRVHLKIHHVHGPESSLIQNVSFSDFLLHDEERVKSLKSILVKNTNRGSSSLSSDLSRRSNHWSSAKSLNIPLNSGLSIGSGNYYVKIGIGSPVKYSTMIMDTGSSFSWIQCKPCAVFCHSQTDPVFDPSSSKTYKTLPCAASACSSLKESTLNSPLCTSSNKCIYTASYGDSSYSIGYLSQDLLTLSQSQTFPNFIYGCGQDNEGLFGKSAGLLGLARDKLSMIAQVSSKYGFSFSYCLPTATASSGGFLKIGKNPSVVTSSFKFTPMVKDPRESSSLYSLRLAAITVAGFPLRVSAAEYKVPTIIDSGTVITRLPLSLYSALQSAFVKIMSKKYAQAPAFSILDTCFKGNVKAMTSGVPEIAMVFPGGAALRLSASNMLIQAGDGVTCLAFAASSEITVIGNHQQQTFEVAYDVANSRIGFAANACR